MLIRLAKNAEDWTAWADCINTSPPNFRGKDKPPQEQQRETLDQLDIVQALVTYPKDLNTLNVSIVHRDERERLIGYLVNALSVQ